MAGKKKNHDSGGASNDWLLTFSDCMTLLLCFFVMLLSFSSFDEMSLQQFSGVFPMVPFPSIFPIKRNIKDSMLEPVDRPIDRTQFGSDKPTGAPPESIKNPKRPPPIPDPDAFRDRRVFHIPSSRLFWGMGVHLKPGGKAYLLRLSKFMELVPCQITIGESRPKSGQGRDIALQRAWIITHYFTDERKLPQERFGVSLCGPETSLSFGDEPVIEIALLARSTYR